jgi:hypothetical protein
MIAPLVFSGLSIHDYPFGFLYRLPVLILPLSIEVFQSQDMNSP